MKLKRFICIFLAVIVLHFCSSEDSDDNDEDKIPDSNLYHPKGTSRDAWVRCRGVPCDKWQRIQLKLHNMKKKLKYTADDDDPDNNKETMDTDHDHPETMSDIAIQNMDVDDDSLPREEDLDEKLSRLSNKTTLRRKRNFGSGYLKEKKFWKSPLYYRFDGTHNSEQKKHVYAGIKVLEDQTCYKFKEIGKNDKPKDQLPLTITASGRGCWSWVGYRHHNVVNLNPACFYVGKALPIHEILHALGLWHEHQRSDRDKYINVFKSGVGRHSTQFHKLYTSTDIQFDANSIMMYPVRLDSKQRAIGFKGPYGKLYDMNMGQRYGISYYNTKSINVKMCAAACKGKTLPQKCQRNGYQDPLDCTRCRCPPGFAGQFCNEIAPGLNMRCGGSFTVRKGGEHWFEFPEGDVSHYPIGVKCYWYFKSVDTTQLQFQFDGLFSVGDTFYHMCGRDYVEVIFKKGLYVAGPRFCGSVVPHQTIVTQGPELLVVFQSALQTPTSKRGGFGVVVTAIGEDSSGVHSTTSKVTTRATNVRTTTTTTEPATTSAGTPSNRISGINRKTGRFQYFFKCSFEQGGHWPEDCGMEQLMNDQSDWRPGKKHDISRNTGPRKAYEGNYYLYVDSRYTRNGDKARLALPVIPRTAWYCFQMKYYMFGPDIRNLRVLLMNPRKGKLRRVWYRGRKYKAIRKWWNGRVKVRAVKGNRFMIQAMMGLGKQGDIAIDNIIVKTC